MAATASVEAGSALAQAIQTAVHTKVVEQGWAAEENDTTLSEYVVTMLVEGKDQTAVRAELGGDLLGMGEDDPQVAEFASWLFEQLAKAQAPQQPQQQEQQQQGQAEQAQTEPNGGDMQMDEDSAAAQVDGAPKGPKSMRNSTRGRRMLGQMNRHIDRAQELPDSLRKIKGAAGGLSGRINSHTREAPRGPKNNSGLQRMAAGGGGRGGHNPMMMNNNNPAAMANGMMGGMAPQQQAQFMQMLEMQAQMMAQMMPGMAAGGGFPPHQNGGGRGAHRGGRGNHHSRGGHQQHQAQQHQQQHAVNGRLPDGPLQPSTDSAMEVDGAEGSSHPRSDLFNTLCRFNLSCTNPACGFAHQSPSAPPNTTVDLTDTCSYGPACANPKCSGRHPSPAQRTEHNNGGGGGGGSTKDVDCRFFPNCTNPRCPFRHPTDAATGKALAPCRNGADCTVPNCSFLHSKIPCRYNPCLNPACPFKHDPGQKRGKFEDKVWTAAATEGGAANGNSKSERFAGFSAGAEGEEELILPGGGAANGEGGGLPQQQQQQEADLIA